MKTENKSVPVILDNPIVAYTDYPIEELGDAAGKEAPIREVFLKKYDGDKYCTISFSGITCSIKRCYLYKGKGRYGEAPNISSIFDEIT